MEEITNNNALTPDAFDYEMCKAGNGKRFANYLLDVVIYYILSFIAGFILGFVLVLTDNRDLVHSKPLLYGVAFIIIFGYYIFFEYAFGRTVGKFATGTKVITTSGERPSLGNVALRTLCRCIPFEPFSFLFGDGWHDSFTNTLVVDIEKIKLLQNQ
jgi:uncharacterized RDD family membrane protein YckC